jgi:hypothetical protein
MALDKCWDVWCWAGMMVILHILVSSLMINFAVKAQLVCQEVEKIQEKNAGHNGESAHPLLFCLQKHINEAHTSVVKHVTQGCVGPATPFLMRAGIPPEGEGCMQKRFLLARSTDMRRARVAFFGSSRKILLADSLRIIIVRGNASRAALKREQ